MSTDIAFRNLSIGESFNFSRNPESGLLADIGKRGLVRYVKTSARTWTDENGTTGRVGTVSARVWVVK